LRIARIRPSRYPPNTTDREVRLMKIAARTVALLLFSTSLLAQPAAPPLRVLSSNGVRAVVESLVPDLEAAIGRKLNIEFSTAASLKERIANGEPFDVAILTPTLIDALVAEQKIVAASRQNFARAGVGVGVRAGAAKPDVSTLDGLKRMLLAAKSVTFTADGQSRLTIDRAFERLGIVADMRAKTLLKGPGEPPHAVAAGEAEVVLTLVSEILPVAGVQLVGPLPPEVQSYVSFTAGRSASTRDAAGADALLRYLASPKALTELGAHGMEPYDR
jgi:molybdate transport system substrate-binding protein